MTSARSILIIVGIVIISGASAGLIHGTVSMLVVNPYIEKAIQIENQALFATGGADDTPEFHVQYEEYREWQRGGQMIAAVVLGSAMGSLFGIVFVILQNSLPGKSYVAKSVFLACVMFCVLYVVPFIKYPPNPPAVGDPETITIRTALYVALLAVSGLGAIFAAKYASHLSKTRTVGSKGAACVGVAVYVVIAAAACIALPPNPDPAPTIDAGLVDGFRSASAIGIASFWISFGVIFGLSWSVRARHRNGVQKNLNSDSMY